MSRRVKSRYAAAAAVLVATGALAPAGPAAADEATVDRGGRMAWQLLYAEDFATPLSSDAQWTVDTERFDTVMDDNGLWWQNDYGQPWVDQYNSFTSYRKEFPVGTDGWLTASLSARDWNNDGVLEAEPSITTENLSGQSEVAKIDVPESTGGAIFRPTKALPEEYRVEYKLKTLDFGGKRDGSIFYDGRENGYSTEGCETQHPWPEGTGTPGWTGDPTVPYCEWQNVRNGPYGYNGFHFMSIVDFANPAPRNNHFWHYRRKVLMDSFAQHPDRVGTGTGGRICDASTGQYYDYKDSNFNTVNMWISGMPDYTPRSGGLTGNSQWFMTTCSDGVAEQQLSTAVEITGTFARSGQQTFRYTRPFVVDNNPIWHYNVTPAEYDGRFNGTLVQDGVQADHEWPDQWAQGSAFPDYFVIGDLYTNVYEGNARLDDIKLFVPTAEK